MNKNELDSSRDVLKTAHLHVLAAYSFFDKDSTPQAERALIELEAAERSLSSLLAPRTSPELDEGSINFIRELGPENMRAFEALVALSSGKHDGWVQGRELHEPLKDEIPLRFILRKLEVFIYASPQVHLVERDEVRRGYAARDVYYRPTEQGLELHRSGLLKSIRGRTAT